MGVATPRLFNIEVARGEVGGYTSLQIAGNNPAVGTTFEDAWDAGGIFSYPTAGETWEVLSNSASDTSAGIGARLVVISGLDTDYVEQTEIITMNGTSAVTTTRTDWFRIIAVLVVSSGSEQTNVGSITIRVASGGTTRSLIQARLARTFNGFYTVPKGKNLLVQQAIVRLAKNEDIILRTNFLLDGTNTFLTGGDVPIYQNQATTNFTSLPVLPEKTDFKVSVKSANSSVAVTLLIEGILASGSTSSNSLTLM